MSDVIVDGRSYPIPTEFTYREMGVIKKIAGLRGGEIGEGLEKGDTDLIVAIAVIAMRRAGNEVDEDFVLDMPSTAIEVKADEEEASPPAKAARGAAKPAA